jgi:hypothetical protein
VAHSIGEAPHADRHAEVVAGPGCARPSAAEAADVLLVVQTRSVGVVATAACIAARASVDRAVDARLVEPAHLVVESRCETDQRECEGGAACFAEA